MTSQDDSPQDDSVQKDSAQDGGPLGWLSRLTGRRQRTTSLRHPGNSFFGLRRGAKAPSAGAQASPHSSSHQEATLNTDEPLRVTAIVQGTVQGVGFRYWTWRQAEKLGLAGSAVNQTDGSVRVVAEGPRSAVRELLRDIQGPDAPGAVFKVDAHYEEAAGGLDGFTTG
ncbi:acylphosphatase [Kocuria coralli]|uniref:acylphosphatase n=1 Tax=Kocuria coralli TaxID=1461025 RepID=A0A5J5L2T6_9MICC|nr:acylphosphatase [Kocuria coralli]